MAMIYLLLSILLSASIFTDIRSQRIPNWLTLSGCLLGVAYHVFMGDGVLFSLAGLGAGIGLFIVPYITGGLGAGDVKLLGAIGSFVGAKGALWVALGGSAIGGIYAVTLLCANGCLRKTARRYKDMLKGIMVTGRLLYIPPSPEEKRLTLCYSIPIAIAGFIFIWTRALGPGSWV